MKTNFFVWRDAVDKEIIHFGYKRPSKIDKYSKNNKTQYDHAFSSHIDCISIMFSDDIADQIRHITTPTEITFGEIKIPEPEYCGP